MTPLEKSFFRITQKLFQTSKPHEEMTTFSRKKYYFFQEEILILKFYLSEPYIFLMVFLT